jgi:DNA-binding NtrC family response regulator
MSTQPDKKIIPFASSDVSSLHRLAREVEATHKDRYEVRVIEGCDMTYHAFRQMLHQGQPPAAIVTDYRTQGTMTGLTLVERVHDIDKKLPVVMLVTDHAIKALAEKRKIPAVMYKPGKEDKWVRDLMEVIEAQDKGKRKGRGKG